MLYLIRNRSTVIIYHKAVGEKWCLERRVTSDTSWQLAALNRLCRCVHVAEGPTEEDRHVCLVAEHDVPLLAHPAVAAVLAGIDEHAVTVRIGPMDPGESKMLYRKFGLADSYHLSAEVVISRALPAPIQDYSDSFYFDARLTLVASSVHDVAKRVLVVATFVPAQVTRRGIGSGAGR